jgi:uncharacterized protein YgbK (DUF1537 family)
MQRGSTMQALIVADDLTGALDSGVTLAELGLACRVARRPSDVAAALAARPDVLAVSTASREGGAAAAREAVARVFDAVATARPAVVFKKIDSRLKGHIADELREVASRTGIGRAVVAPAVPAQGRITEGGRLTGAGVGAPIDVAAALSGSGLELDVPDTRGDGDLDRALAAAFAGPPALLVGAAGLAAALARYLRPGRPARAVAGLPAPLVLAIGSRDPITHAQVDAVLAARLVDELAAPGGELPGSAAIGERPLLVRLAAGAAATDPRTAGARFARAIAGIVAPGEAGTLFACGGETADAILGALGVGALAIEGQLLPGVPVSRMVVNGRDMQLVTKSGGFGSPDTIISVVRCVRRDG